jgi:hypothetical protein
MKYGVRQANINAFNKRNDKLKFESYGNKFDTEHEAVQFCFANFVHNSDSFVYSDYMASETIYKEWKKYFKFFNDNFKDEFAELTKVMQTNSVDFKQMQSITKGWNHPPLLQMYLHGTLTAEFIVTLDSKFSFLESWLESYGGVDPFIEKKLTILTKYKPICILISKEVK